ncbi:MAG: hypothetical protein Kow0068_02520 [Marinilabiliales bacterium]
MNTIEVCGTILKEELLSSLNQNIIPNTCVLEDIEPFPGYYGNAPINKQPCCVFIMLSRHYSYEEILKATKSIKSYFPHPFSASKAEIQFYNTIYHGIRIRHIISFDIIPELQKCYINENLKLRGKKVNVNSTALIKIIKTFKLNEIEDGIYMDLTEKEFGYFEIEQNPSWKLFENQIKKLKYNWSKQRFDCALGSLFRFDGIKNIIRIYSENISWELLKEIKEQYNKYQLLK